MMEKDATIRKVKLEKGQKTCPICAKITEEKYFPFCSKRCADVDLHRWLKGTYSFPSEEEIILSAEMNDMISSKKENE